MDQIDARLRILREAISIESYGYDFYNIMRSHVRDKSAQVVLSFLASMEADHMIWLEKEYMRQLRSMESMASGHSHGIKMSAVEEMFVTGSLPELYRGSDMRKALEFAVEVELRSMKFYTDAMNLADDDEMKLLFRKLVDFEMDHAKLLKMNIENLKNKGIWVEPEGL